MILLRKRVVHEEVKGVAHYTEYSCRVKKLSAPRKWEEIYTGRGILLEGPGVYKQTPGGWERIEDLSQNEALSNPRR